MAQNEAMDDGRRYCVAQKLKIEPRTVREPMVADSYRITLTRNRDPAADPDPHQNEKMDLDPHLVMRIRNTA